MEVGQKQPDGFGNPENLLEESQSMSRLQGRIKKSLKKEAVEWDASVSKESPERIASLLDKAEVFVARRPPKQPVCLRLDPFDVSILKRIARRKGVPFTQLMSMWLHEKIEQEKSLSRRPSY